MNLPTPSHLGLRSEMIFHRAHGVVERHDGYWAIRTPENPTYFWGNYLEFDRAPRAGDAPRWIQLFGDHIGCVQPESKHIALSWTEQAVGERQQFVEAGFATKEAVVMTATRLLPVPAPRADVELRPLGPGDWTALADLQTLERAAEHPEDEFRAFIERYVEAWRRLAAQGVGGWWGALAGAQLVAALGLYWDSLPGADGERLGRYQMVVTRPDWRRRGLCRALVHAAGTAALSAGLADRLVIVADAHDVARGIYEAAGFAVVESWYGVAAGGVLTGERRRRWRRGRRRCRTRCCCRGRVANVGREAGHACGRIVDQHPW